MNHANETAYLAWVLASFLPTIAANAADALKRPNILLVTVDDMSCDSLGAFGCKLADTSP